MFHALLNSDSHGKMTLDVTHPQSEELDVVISKILL